MIHALMIIAISLLSAGRPAAAPRALDAVVPMETLPGDWAAFTSQYAVMGLGTWTSTGVTKDMWAGLPAGLAYTETSSESFSPDGKAIFGGYTMTLKDGTVISTGTTVIVWDAKTGKVLRTGSGFDLGRPFAGTSTLKGIDATRMTWEYVEESGGKTSRYENTVTRAGFNQRRKSVRKLPYGKPWETTSRRFNPFAKILAEFDVVGRWEMRMPDGTVDVTVYRLDLDGRSIAISESKLMADGTTIESGASTMWWDGGRDNVRFLWLNAEGVSVEGEMVSVERKDGRVTMVSRHEGANAAGDAVSATITRSIEGDVMTTTFTDFSAELLPIAPAWVGLPMTARRVAAD